MHACLLWTPNRTSAAVHHSVSLAMHEVTSHPIILENYYVQNHGLKVLFEKLMNVTSSLNLNRSIEVENGAIYSLHLP